MNFVQKNKQAYLKDQLVEIIDAIPTVSDFFYINYYTFPRISMYIGGNTSCEGLTVCKDWM